MKKINIVMLFTSTASIAINNYFALLDFLNFIGVVPQIAFLMAHCCYYAINISASFSRRVVSQSLKMQFGAATTVAMIIEEFFRFSVIEKWDLTLLPIDLMLLIFHIIFFWVFEKFFHHQCGEISKP